MDPIERGTLERGSIAGRRDAKAKAEAKVRNNNLMENLGLRMQSRVAIEEIDATVPKFRQLN